ncbi:hypothetical protein [Streptomyces sp. NPDC056492]|uniref:hypothetical protein n=1 Tax=unclassified Streptomyces TaxID=2593676 RepID=UPI0036BFBFF0
MRETAPWSPPPTPATATGPATATDPRDRRRTLVRRDPEVSDRRAEVAAAPVDGALSTALGTTDPAEPAEVTALLESLARRLSPEMLTRPTPESTSWGFVRRAACRVCGTGDGRGAG